MEAPNKEAPASWFTKMRIPCDYITPVELEGGQLSGSLTVAKGATVNALSGADLLLATSGKTITNSGLISVENGATLTLSGTVRNSGTLFADAGTLDIAGVVSGGTTQ